MLAQNDVLEFFNLFSGAKEFYGVTNVGDIVNGKAKSTSKAIHDVISPALYDRHLKGDISIGVSPLKSDSTVSFGAIDIDNYVGDLNDIIASIYYHDLPICPCYSKSKKLHLYFFFALETPAEEAIQLMSWYAMAFGCDRKVEIFPKQAIRTVNNKAYSWINLPYTSCEDEHNHRKMVKEDLTLAPLSEFLERASRAKLSLQEHWSIVKSQLCWDAPPCILTGYMLRDIGQGGRNEWLFSCAVYFKLKDENCDLEAKLLEINNSLKDPLDEQELRQTVLSSMQRRSYFYLCNRMSRCDKVACSKLEWGVGSTKSTGLEYGDMKQKMSDPPTYEWEVNGKNMFFESESELLRQDKFRCLCLRELHKVPRKVDDNIWTKILNKALANVQVVYEESKGGDFSKGSIFYDYACSFFGDKRKAANPSQVYMGRVFVDEKTKEYVFQASTFLSYITDTKGFKGFSQLEMKHRLEEMGAKKMGNVWRIPMSSFPEEDLNRGKNIEIDLDLKEGESNDF